MFKKVDRKARRQKKHYRVRRNISGTAEYPRLAVYRSAKHIYAQIIDDTLGHTLAAASTLDASLKENYGGNTEAAKAVGKLLAERALAKGIKRTPVSWSGCSSGGGRQRGRPGILRGGYKTWLDLKLKIIRLK